MKYQFDNFFVTNKEGFIFSFYTMQKISRKPSNSIEYCCSAKVSKPCKRWFEVKYFNQYMQAS